MPGYVIRNITLDEIEALNAIDMSYVSTYGYGYAKVATASGWRFELARKEHERPFERIYDWDWREVDDLPARIARNAVWAAFALETVVAVLEIRQEEWNGTAWIQSLYVDRGHRRRGIGKILCETAVRFARQAGARALFVETQISNGPAIDFYLGCGFTPCGVNDHFYTNDDIRHDEVALFLVMPLA